MASPARARDAFVVGLQFRAPVVPVATLPVVIVVARIPGRPLLGPLSEDFVFLLSVVRRQAC